MSYSCLSSEYKVYTHTPINKTLHLIRFFLAWPIFTKFCTKFYHNLTDGTVVFSVCFYDRYFILFAYWLSSWLPNPSKWNSCFFNLRNLVSVNKISCQNEWYQLVLRPKYSFTKTTKLYLFLRNELYKLVYFEIFNAKIF